jgi:hypothetical protein
MDIMSKAFIIEDEQVVEEEKTEVANGVSNT